MGYGLEDGATRVEALKGSLDAGRMIVEIGRGLSG